MSLLINQIEKEPMSSDEMDQLLRNCAEEIWGNNNGIKGVIADGKYAKLKTKSKIRVHLKTILNSIFLFMLCFLGVYQISYAGLPSPKRADASYFQGGYPGAGKAYNLNNISVSSINFQENYALVDGWTTFALQGNQRITMRTPRIRGRYASQLYDALQRLSNEGYTTVDITLWEGVVAMYGSSEGGWKIVGRDNPKKESEELQKQQRELDRKNAQRNRARNNRNYEKPSNKSSNSAIDNVYLFQRGECNCGFGTGVFATNKGNRPIMITVKRTTHGYRTTYDIVKELVVPGDEVYLGCTRFGNCQFERNSATFSYKVTGAYYTK